MFEPKLETAAALLVFSCSGSLLFLFTVPLGLGGEPSTFRIGKQPGDQVLVTVRERE